MPMIFLSFAKRNVAPYISPIMDSATLFRVCNDLGISGRALPKVINGSLGIKNMVKK
jgi:hypothetical protein